MRKAEPLIDDEKVMWAARALARTMGATSESSGDIETLRTRAEAFRIFAVRTGLVHMHESAISYYESALQRDPGDAASHAGMGRALACLGRIDKALKSLEAALELAPGALLYLEHGKYLFALGRHDEAAAAFGRAIDLDPDSPAAHAWRGEALSRGGRPGVIGCLEHAVELSPESAPAHNRLAVALLGASRHDEASRHFGLAVSLDPVDVTLYSGSDEMRWFGYLSGPTAGTAGDASNDEGALAHAICQEELVTLVKTIDSIEKLRQTLALAPDDLGAYLELGLAYLVAGRHPDALEAFDWAISINSNSLEAHFNRCRALALMGKHEEALRALETAAGLSPADTGFHLRKGNALCRMGLYAGAISACRSAMALDPACPETHKTLAAICTTFGVYGEALELIDRAIRLVSNDAVSYVHRGYVLESMDRVSDAMGAFYQATQTRPDTWSLVPQP